MPSNVKKIFQHITECFFLLFFSFSNLSNSPFNIFISLLCATTRTTDGVFLLLGYSSTDEALLRPHTNLGIQDAVRALQQYVIKHVDNQTSCTLTLYNMTDENIILSVRLPHDSKANTLSLLKQEKVSESVSFV